MIKAYDIGIGSCVSPERCLATFWTTITKLVRIGGPSRACKMPGWKGKRTHVHQHNLFVTVPPFSYDVRLMQLHFQYDIKRIAAVRLLGDPLLFHVSPAWRVRLRCCSKIDERAIRKLKLHDQGAASWYTLEVTTSASVSKMMFDVKCWAGQTLSCPA